MAIMNSNRNIYEWTKRRKKIDPYQAKLGYDEVHGLVKNWIVRKLRVIIPFTELHNLFRRGNLSLSVSQVDSYIVSVKLTYDEHWNSAKNWAALISNILITTNYESLKYDEDFYDKQHRLGEIHENPKEIIMDFSSIEKIKF